jgi:regulatory protein YycI of two-component signal transduction system YycFG
MHWGQIKTLLILSFFILDIYLLAQFMEKKELSDIAILEEQTSTIEEQLKAEDITVADLPEQEFEETFISVKQKNFREQELVGVKDRVKQKRYILNENLIAAKLDEPIKVKRDDSQETITNLFKKIVYFPEEYTFWSWNKELNAIIFFQNKMDRPVYYNQNGLVLLFLNEDNKITYYTQTMLGEAEALSEKQKLIKPMRAVEKLYDTNELYPGDKITNVHIGFHTRMPFESGVQVFAPIWKVNVNGEKDYFVNAIEGFIFSTEEQEFLLEAMKVTTERMQVNREVGSPIDEMINDLKARQNGITSVGGS